MHGMYTSIEFDKLTAGCEDDVAIPDYKTQRTEIHADLQQRLKARDTWYCNTCIIA